MKAKNEVEKKKHRQALPPGLTRVESPSRSLVPWLTVLALALVLRCWVAWELPTTPLSDFRSYFTRAVNLLETGVYGIQPGVPDATWPPGFSLWLAAIVRLFGPSEIAARLANALLGTLSVGLIGGLASRLWGQRVGWSTALLLAVYPRALMQTSLLASEGLFVPLFAGFVWASSVNFGRTDDGPWWRAVLRPEIWLAGLCLGLAALTRSIGYFGLFLLPVAGLASGKSWRVVLRDFLVVAVIAHAVLLPWGLRNRNAMGQFTWFTTASGMSLLLGNNAEATGQWYYAGEQFTELGEHAPRSNGVALNAYWASAAKQWMLSHPVDAGRLYAKKLQMMLGDGRRIVMLTTQASEDGKTALAIQHPMRRWGPWLGRKTILAYRCFVLLALVGLGVALRRWYRRKGARDAETGTVLLLLFSAGLFIGMGALVFGNPRFRWPAEDLLMPFAGLAIGASVAWLRRYRPRRRDHRRVSASIE